MAKKTILNNLWTYRKRFGLSQKQAAFLLDHKTTSQLSRYEKGTKVPGLETALKLEILYRVPVAFLFYDCYQKLKDEIRSKEDSLRMQAGSESRIDTRWEGEDL